jgi:hypothetical protein
VGDGGARRGARRLCEDLTPTAALAGRVSLSAQQLYQAAAFVGRRDGDRAIQLPPNRLRNKTEVPRDGGESYVP